jgi:hypothetical protein
MTRPGDEPLFVPYTGVKSITWNGVAEFPVKVAKTTIYAPLPDAIRNFARFKPGYTVEIDMKPCGRGDLYVPDQVICRIERISGLCFEIRDLAVIHAENQAVACLFMTFDGVLTFMTPELDQE